MLACIGSESLLTDGISTIRCCIMMSISISLWQSLPVHHRLLIDSRYVALSVDNNLGKHNSKELDDNKVANITSASTSKRDCSDTGETALMATRINGVSTIGSSLSQDPLREVTLSTAEQIEERIYAVNDDPMHPLHKPVRKAISVIEQALDRYGWATSRLGDVMLTLQSG